MKFRKLLALAGVFFGMSTVALAQTQADDECLNPGSDELLKQGCTYLDEFMKAFNSRDAEAWAKTVHYPHIRIAAGQVQIWNTPEEYAQSNDAKQLAQASTWAVRRGLIASWCRSPTTSCTSSRGSRAMTPTTSRYCRPIPST